MATDYFVIVARLNQMGQIKPKMCGRLWATHHSKAEIEAGVYREKVNKGKSLAELLDKFYVVTAVPYSVARSYKSYPRFKNNRVTPNPNEKKS